MNKICLYCQKEYTKPPCFAKSKFCSRECYLKYRWGRGKCKFCGKETELTYCNKKCRDAFWMKNEYRLLKKKRHWGRKLLIIKKLGGKCRKCGISDIRVLDVNHLDMSKKRKPKTKIGHLPTYNTSFRLKEWEENMNNIELLCANCHRIHTWEQLGYGKY